MSNSSLSMSIALVLSGPFLHPSLALPVTKNDLASGTHAVHPVPLAEFNRISSSCENLSDCGLQRSMRSLTAEELELIAVAESYTSGPGGSGPPTSGHCDANGCTVTGYPPAPPPNPPPPPPPPPPAPPPNPPAPAPPGSGGGGQAVDPPDGCYGSGTADTNGIGFMETAAGVFMNPSASGCTSTSHAYSNAASLPGQPKAGKGECTDLAFKYLNAPPVGQWSPGQSVQGANLPVGTAIGAGFQNGVFPIQDTGQHFAFYLGQDSTGIQVVDQWVKLPAIGQRTIPWNGYPAPNNTASNTGSQFVVIQWPDCGGG